MASLEVDDVDALVFEGKKLRDHFESFSSAISLPSLDESAMFLANIVYASSHLH